MFEGREYCRGPQGGIKGGGKGGGESGGKGGGGGGGRGGGEGGGECGSGYACGGRDLSRFTPAPPDLQCKKEKG